MTQPSDSPAELLDATRQLIAYSTHESDDAVGVWPRAAAHLSRQALELALDHFWQACAPRIRDLSMRAQLVCLPGYLNDRVLAGRTSIAWAALSGACHHHAYELAPTELELQGWVEVVEDLMVGLRKAAGVS